MDCMTQIHYLTSSLVNRVLTRDSPSLFLFFTILSPSHSTETVINVGNGVHRESHQASESRTRSDSPANDGRNGSSSPLSLLRMPLSGDRNFASTFLATVAAHAANRSEAGMNDFVAHDRSVNLK